MHSEYELLYSEKPEDLALQVAEHMKDGWQLYSSPIAGPVFVYQAMTRVVYDNA